MISREWKLRQASLAFSQAVISAYAQTQLAAAALAQLAGLIEEPIRMKLWLERADEAVTS